jgi:cobalt-zinc-cadmium efflux system membrane fusion protein
MFKPFASLHAGLCGALLLAGCQPAAGAGAEATRARIEDKSIHLSGASSSYIRTEPAAPAPSAAERSLVARVAFDDRKVARLGPPVQGRVSNVNVLTGDQVAKGAILLTIRAPDIAAAQAQLAQATTARGLAEHNAERASLLADKGAGSDAERQQAEGTLAQARVEEQRAVAALAALGGSHGLNEYQLKAPLSGLVVERNVAVGTEVHVDQDLPLITIADLSTVWVEAEVYEQDLSRIHVGDEAKITVVAFPGRAFSGHITYLGNTVDPQTRVMRARIEVGNADLSLRPGMFADVQVKGLSEGVAEVPLNAVLARRDQFFVFVRNPDGTFSEHEVKPGEQHGEHVAILSGIKPGDSIVTEGAILLDAEANEAL